MYWSPLSVICLETQLSLKTNNFLLYTGYYPAL